MGLVETLNLSLSAVSCLVWLLIPENSSLGHEGGTALDGSRHRTTPSGQGTAVGGVMGDRSRKCPT